jgi:hypothetical protein
MLKRFSHERLRELHKLVQTAMLTAYPNPDRIDCPGSEVLQQIAALPRPWEHADYSHLMQCSPCLREMLDLRIAFSHQKRRLSFSSIAVAVARHKRILAFATAVLVCAFVIGTLVFLLRRPVSQREFAMVAVDLTEAGTFRGSGDDDEPVLAKLPKKLDELHIALPRFSRQGRYLVAILKSRTENAAIALGSAATAGKIERATLVVTLDLSSAKPGRYFLATRLEEQGQEEAAYYYPVVIRQ